MGVIIPKHPCVCTPERECAECRLDRLEVQHEVVESFLRAMTKALEGDRFDLVTLGAWHRGWVVEKKRRGVFVASTASWPCRPLRQFEPDHVVLLDYAGEPYFGKPAYDFHRTPTVWALIDFMAQFKQIWAARK